jgi:hypothetical protein
MMKNRKEVRSSLQLLLQLQRFSAKRKNSGYALLVTSLVAILLFSMISAYLFSNKIYKSSANAMIDAGSTFYASEFGLNKRAENVRKKFDSYSSPTGTSPGVAGDSVANQMANCLSSASTAQKGSGDFECKVDETIQKEAYTSFNSMGAASNAYGANPNVKYKSYSFVRPISSSDELKVIETGSFSGLRAQEYSYRVYSTAVKQIGVNSNSIGAQAMLQMEFVNHYIPVFQFAAFYEKDLEMTNSGTMTVSGPVHTNSSLYFAPGGLLTLNNRSTFVNNAFRTLSYGTNHGSTPEGRRILLVGGGPYSTGVNTTTIAPGVVGLNAIDATAAFTNAGGTYTSPQTISDADITASKSMLKKITKLQLPPVGFLSRAGEYFDKADLRVDFDPLNRVLTTPFNVTSINRVAGTSEDFNTQPGLIDSLQKPVLLRIDSFTPNQQLSAVSRLCPKLDGGMGEPTTMEGATTGAIPIVTTAPLALDYNGRKKVIAALQEAIARTPNITYESTKVAAATTSTTFRDALRNAMKNARPDGLPVIASATADIISNQPLNQIAALNVNVDPTGPTDPLKNGKGGCFLPAPMRMINGIDRKENFNGANDGGRAMTILQSNIKSLTAWNRDGKYWNASLLPTAEKLFATKTATAVPIGLVNLKATGSCDMECLGLAPSDTTEAGLVWHYSLINRTSANYNYLSGNGTTRSDVAGVSPFGFAFSGGNRLPGALTIATDQAAYLQGDYNNASRVAGDRGNNPNAKGVLDLDQSQFADTNPNTATNIPPAREKKPASVLSDTMTILSNACYDNNYLLSCLTPASIAMPIAGDATVKRTVVRAAILSGTESTVLNAGGGMVERGAALNNHIRMLEDWYNPIPAGLPDKTFKYRGSFVSKGIPTEFNGQYRGGNGFTPGTYYGIPNRDFGFDEDFNRVDGLPPLTPRVNFLTQQVFKRDYDSQNR